MAKGRMLQNRISKSKKIIPKEVRLGVVEKCGPECVYCGKEGFVSEKFGKPVVLEKETMKKWINEFDGTYHKVNRPMQFDHIIPISKGGETTIENMVISCSFCNQSKKDCTDGRWKNAKKGCFS